VRYFTRSDPTHGSSRRASFPRARNIYVRILLNRLHGRGPRPCEVDGVAQCVAGAAAMPD